MIAKFRPTLVLFLIIFSMQMFAPIGPVTPGQSLWCITKAIGSVVDIIDNKFTGNFDIGQLDQPLCSKIDIIQVNAIDSISKLCQAVSYLDPLLKCLATPVSEPTTLSAPGVYCLSNNVAGNIAIEADDVCLDLNNYVVTGNVSINNGVTRVIINNGVVDNNNQLGDAIGVSAGSTDITIRDVVTKNALVGINFEGVSGGVIQNCEMSQNITGVQLDQSHKITIDSCIASCNQNAGYCLISSTTCCVINAKAISTGQGNANSSNQTIVGFISDDGYGNIFEQCIANGTQGLQVTDVDSLIAGFALRNGEQCTKIIACESSNAQATADGSTNVYGIYVDPDQSVKKNIIIKNVVYCNTVGGNGTGILGSDLMNLIIQNTTYNNPINLQIGSLADQIISQIDSPTLLQNIAVPGCGIIQMPVDLALLAEQSISLMETLQIGVTDIENKVNDLMIITSACDPTIITGSAILSTPGIYCVGNPIMGTITITGDDIVLDINQYRIIGQLIIEGTASNVIVKNGTVDADNSLLDAIDVSAGAQNITIENVVAKNGLIGMNFEGVSGGTISNCEFVKNSTGLELDASHKIVIDNCTANCNTNAGFCLITSTTCCVIDSKALSTGEGNANTANQTIIGFVSTNGYANIFERCIANATQALSTTDSQSLVAGFALRGSESCSKIIECESANAQTDPNGYTLPYGVLLESEFNGFIELQTINPGGAGATDRIKSAVWSPDGKYLAVGGEINSTQDLFIYEFDSVGSTLNEVVSLSPTGDPIADVDWSPDGLFLSVSIQVPEGDDALVYVYEFNRNNNELIFLDVANLGPFNSPLYPNRGSGISSHWSENGKFLAIVSSQLTAIDQLFVYSFDRVKNKLTFLISGFPRNGNIQSTVHDVRWRPNGNTFIAVTGFVTGPNTDDLFIFKFDEANNSLMQIDSALVSNFDVLQKVRWTPDGRYILGTGDVDTTGPPDGPDLFVYEFSNNQLSLFAASYPTPGGPTPSLSGLSISSDGQFIVAGGADIDTGQLATLFFYKFNPSGPTIEDRLVLISSINPHGATNPDDDILTIDFHPGGKFLAIGGELEGSGTTNDLILYQVLNSPEKNIIKDNVVYCNGNNPLVNGIGISVPSISNMVIGNTAYANPVDPLIVPTNYAYVTNIFNQFFVNQPTALQNISVGGCEQICHPVDIALFVQQIKPTIINTQSFVEMIESKVCVLESKFDAITACMPMQVSGATNIDTPGIYCLNQNVIGSILISSDEVELDLNNYTVTGDISIGAVSNVLVYNGVVDNNDQLSDAIGVAAGASNISMRNIIAKNALVGINFNSVSGGLIEHCSFMQNVTGVELDQSNKITIDSCIASYNVNAGYCLITSTTCCVIDSKALSTGEGNNELTNQTIFGFVSTDGNANIFERCIANATQALSTTDYNSIVAGIALRGSESCTKIIECEASNAQTSANGVTIPYGIWLENRLSSEITLTGIPPIPIPNDFVSYIDWSPDGALLAAAVGAGDIEQIRVYTYDRVKNILYQEVAVDVQPGVNARELRWSPSGNYLVVATGGTNVEPHLVLYEYDSAFKQLILVAQVDNIHQSTNGAFAVDWHPSENYIIVGLQQPDTAAGNLRPRIVLFEFDRVANQLIERDGVNSADNPEFAVLTVKWTPDGNYFATGNSTPSAPNFANTFLRLYKFDEFSKTFSQYLFPKQPNDVVLDLDWSPDGKYLAVAITGAIFTSSQDAFLMYDFTDTSTLVNIIALFSDDSINAVEWSPDGKQLIIADNKDLLIYDFDRGNNQLNFVSTQAVGQTPQFGITNVAWSPDGGTIGICASDINRILLYDAYQYPSKNIIKDNVVYCNANGRCPGGFGISGSSIANMIIGNTSYANPPMPLAGFDQNYVFVTNIFNPFYEVAPTSLENISIAGCTPICTPADLVLLADHVGLAAIDLDSKLDITESKIDIFNALNFPVFPCGRTSISQGTDINTPGIYCVDQNITGNITISANDVDLDINNFNITGTISGSGVSNVEIKNGTIYANSSTDAIRFDSNSMNVRLRNIHTKNADQGICFDGVTRGLIENCSMTSNGTGLALQSSHKIVVDNCTADCNVCEGFSLISSTTCSVINSKALSTGQGNTDTLAHIVGFYSRNGYGNIFEQCIANGTQGLSATSYSSVVSGFVLSGSESGSKIIDCESANAQTSINGEATPVGILLEESVENALESVLTIANPGSVTGVDWTQDGKYIAIGVGDGYNIPGIVLIYQFDGITESISEVLSFNAGFGSVYAVRWSPDGQFLAVGYEGTDSSNRYRVYEFDRNTNSLIEQPILQMDDMKSVVSFDWHPTYNYLAVLEGELSDTEQLYIFSYDRVAKKFALVDTKTAVASNFYVWMHFVRWSPDGSFLVVADGYANPDIKLYRFSNNTLTQVDTETFDINSGQITWSPDGKYLACTFNGGRIVVFELDPVAGTLANVIDDSSLANSSVTAFSPDSRYICSSSADDVLLFRHNRDMQTLTLVATAVRPSPNFFLGQAAWRSDGKYIAVIAHDGGGGGSQPFFGIYRGLSFPSKNVIKGNTVYCNSGGAQPSGIGISGSSIANLIVDNVSYNNPQNPFMVSTNYAFVTNVFNPLFNNEPSLLQNISVGGCDQVCQPADLALLASQIKAKLCAQFESTIPILQSKVEALEMPSIAPCDATPILATDLSTAINTSGIYCLESANVLTGNITINAADTQLDLNNRTLAGQVIVNASNVTIKNGTVDAGALVDAIQVNGGSDNISLNNVVAKNGLVGLSIASVSGGVVSNCEFISNTTGVQLDSAHKIIFDNCIADCNINAGFDLINSTTNCFTECKAVSTGQSNANFTDQTVCGFVSTDGSANIFERCIANATQALSTTDSNSLVAGFALRGTESCTKIIECESGNTQASFEGDITSYGIYIDPAETVQKNVIIKNIVYCISGADATGILGSDLRNLIIQNVVYNSGANLQVGSQADEIISMIDNPTLLQNIALPGCEQICQPADIPLLIAQLKAKICSNESVADLIESKVDLISGTIAQLDVCNAVMITSAPTEISISGIYCLSQNIAGSVLISADDVQLDLNNYNVTGDITGSNVNNVLIKNGVVENSGGDAIVFDGSTNITIQSITAKNSLLGINFANVTGGLVENCTLTHNVTGLELENSHKIMIDDCTAYCNTNAGYCLLTSTTCCITDCKALSTGEDNTNVLNQIVVGFVSANGYGNIFERCIANSTQALSTTDSQSLVAGFALRGTEGCSKIIDCESANATTSSDGVTVPYGILLEAQFEGLTNVVQDAVVDIRALNWSSDGKYLAVGGSLTVGNGLTVYEFDRVDKQLIELASINNGGANIRGVDWSPDGDYLAVGGNFTGNDLYIYQFDRTLGNLTEIVSIAKDTSVTALSWSPDGNFLVIGGNFPGNDDVVLYQFDKIAQTLTQIQLVSVPGSFALSVDWSPDGNYLAVGGNFTTADLILYRFDTVSHTLVQIDSKNPGGGGPNRTVDWSPDGNYLAVGGLLSGADLTIYQFNKSAGQLVEIISLSPSGGSDFLDTVHWSADGNYLAVGGLIVDDDLYIYQFDRGTNDLIKLQSISPGGEVLVARWSPDGAYLAIGGLISGDDLYIYTGLTFPSKNIIKDNVVYCNSGASIPSGIGISGSSIASMIIGNVSYNNPQNPFMVSQNYGFVTNIFNPLFQDEPTLLQNLSIEGCQPICMPTDLDLLLKQSKYKLCYALSELDVVESILDNFANTGSQPGPCDPVAITTSPTTLTGPGIYCIANATISGLITIDGSDVQLDLNNYTISGGIVVTSHHNQVTIKNGAVSNFGSDAILTSSGCTDIYIQNVTAKNSLIGINFDQVVGGIITNCSMTKNTTGMQLNSSAKITVDSCMADCNLNAGFDLIMSSTCCLIDCKALSTGEGNEQETNQTIVGFISDGGYANIFENCIANGTQGLQVTDTDSLIAGFALRTSEQCSKIISCESGNTMSDLVGTTTVYGIYLQDDLAVSKNVIMKNTVYCTSGGSAGVGIYGSDLANLIIQNVTYNNSVNIQTGSMFDQLITSTNTSGLLQNIALTGCEPICLPEDLGLLLKKINYKVSTVGCEKIVINSQDIVSGTISITESGAYCLAEDLTADMVISATCASIDMNNRILTGEMTIQDSVDVQIFDGKLQPAAPTVLAKFALTIAADALRTQILRLEIVCADTTADSIDGRSGINLFGGDALISGCTIKSGAGAANSSGVGGDGGMGIILRATAQRALIQNCVIQTGDGGDGTTEGGNGGDGITVASGANETKIIGCTIFRVGAPGSPLGASSPQGGDGIVIESGSIKTLVTQCIVRNSTQGAGTVSSGGLAVDNRSVSSDRSVIYENVVYNIGNAVKYSNFGSGMLNEFGVQMDAPPSNDALNKIANVFFEPIA